jgi:hypothetical protein
LGYPGDSRFKKKRNGQEIIHLEHLYIQNREFNLAGVKNPYIFIALNFHGPFSQKRSLKTFLQIQYIFKGKQEESCKHHFLVIVL